VQTKSFRPAPTTTINNELCVFIWTSFGAFDGVVKAPYSAQLNTIIRGAIKRLLFAKKSSHAKVAIDQDHLEHTGIQEPYPDVLMAPVKYSSGALTLMDWSVAPEMRARLAWASSSVLRSSGHLADRYLRVPVPGTIGCKEPCQ
jgi:hypothetical protein